TFSPRVEDPGEGIVYIDIAGMERHFQASGLGPQASDHEHPGGGSEARGPRPEALLGREAMKRCEAIGLPARVGIAASKLAARVAAELPKSPTVVEPGNEAEFLAPLPLTRLAPEIDAAVTLQRWGITSIGDFARLPESEIASRLGETGRDLHYAARGIDPRPLIPRALPPEFRAGMDLEWP